MPFLSDSYFSNLNSEKTAHLAKAHGFYTKRVKRKTTTSLTFRYDYLIVFVFPTLALIVLGYVCEYCIYYVKSTEHVYDYSRGVVSQKPDKRIK